MAAASTPVADGTRGSSLVAGIALAVTVPADHAAAGADGSDGASGTPASVKWSASLSSAIDISDHVRPNATDQAEAFALPPATANPVKFGDFELSVDKGASVNCPVCGTQLAEQMPLR